MQTLTGHRTDVKDGHDRIFSTVGSISPIGMANHSKDAFFNYTSLDRFNCDNVTLHDFAGSGYLSDSAIKYFNNMTQSENLLKFICNKAKDRNLAPSVSAVGEPDANKGVFLSLDQVSHLLGNILMDNVNSENQNGKRKFGGSLYSQEQNCGETGTPFHYQLCSYLAAMHAWMIREQYDSSALSRSLVLYGSFESNLITAPTNMSSNRSVKISYDCNNRPVYNPNITKGLIRTLDAGDEPCGSYALNIGAPYMANEEAVCQMYPEVLMSYLLVPSPSGPPGVTSWHVIGTNIYFNYPVNQNISVPFIGSPNDNYLDVKIGNTGYNISASGMVALAGEICSPGFDAADPSVDRAWNFQQNRSSAADNNKTDVNLYFTKANSVFNTKTWEGPIKELNSKLNNDMQNWNLVLGRWGSGDWFCNPTWSMMVQAMSAAYANKDGHGFESIYMCNSHLEPSMNQQVCVCSLSDDTCDSDCYKKQYKALTSQKFYDGKSIGGWKDCKIEFPTPDREKFNCNPTSASSLYSGNPSLFVRGLNFIAELCT